LDNNSITAFRDGADDELVMSALDEIYMMTQVGEAEDKLTTNE